MNYICIKLFLGNYKIVIKSTMSKNKQSYKSKTDRFVDMSKQDDFLFNRTPILASALQKLKQTDKSSNKKKAQQNRYQNNKSKFNQISDDELDQISAPKKKVKKNPENLSAVPNFAYTPLQKDLYSFYTINKTSLKNMESVPQPKFEIGSLALTAICDRGIGGKFLVTNFFRNKKGYIDYKQLSYGKSGSKDNNFDAIQSYTQPGQFVIGSVVKSLSTNHIQLSLKKFIEIQPKQIKINQVLPAQVKSKQQLGCHLIVPECSQFKFFLPKSEVSQIIYSQYITQKKQVIVSVSSIDHSRNLIKVNLVSSTFHEQDDQISLKDVISLKGIEEEQLSQYSLQQYVSPGNLVHIKVIKILANGVMVKFLKIFIGFIHADHLKNSLQTYKVDQKMLCRIIYSCSNPPLIYLSQRHTSLHNYEPKIPLYNGVNKPKSLEQIQKSYINKQQQFYVHPSQMHTEIQNIGKFWSKQNNYFQRYQIMTTRKIGLRVGQVAKEIPFNNFKVFSGASSNADLDSKKKFKVMCLDVWNKVVKISYDEKIIKSNKMLHQVEDIDLNNQEQAAKQYCGFIKSISQNGVVVQFCNNIYGTIPKHQMKISGMQIDETWKGKGIEVYLAHIKQKNGFITLSLLPPNMRKKHKSDKKNEENYKNEGSQNLMGTIVSIVPNSIYPIYIKLRQKTLIKVSIFKGIRPASLNNLSTVQNLTQNFEVGQKIRVFRKGKQYFLYPPEQLSDKDLRICRLISFKGSYARLQTGKNQFHSCHITDVSDLIIPYPFNSLQLKQYYIGRLLPNNFICLRNSIVINGIPKSILDCKQKYSNDENRGDYRNRILTVGSNGLKQDMIIFGYIKTFNEKGCFVSVSNDYEVRIEHSELSDSPISGDKSKYFPPNRLILCRLISEKIKPNDPTKHLFDASARQSVVKLGYPLNDELLQVGLTVSGYVTGFAKGKALVRLCGSRFTGIIHPNQVPDINKEESIQKSLKIGTFFDQKLKVIQFNNDGKRLIRLSAQPKYFNKYKEIQVDITPNERVINLFNSYQDMLQQKPKQIHKQKVHQQDEDSEDQYNRIQNLLAQQMDEQIQQQQQQNIQNGEMEEEENGEQIQQQFYDDQMEQQSQEQNNESQQNKAQQNVKDRILAQFSSLPHNQQTYQSLILANNTSESHIKYISSMLNSASPEKIREQFVRSIAQLEQIKDKQNLWVAWLNMETILGNFEQTVKKAIKAEVGIQVYSRILQILRQQDKWELATEIAKKMLKKNNRDPKVYTIMLRHYLIYCKQQNEDEKPHYKQIIRRAKQCLKASQLILVESQYGKILYQQKQAEKARTVFGDLLQSNPKRTDLWSMYIDLQIKYGTVEKARQIMERCLTVSLKKKKMITMLKKYYQIEQTHGTSQSAAKILERAKKLADQYAQNQQDSNEDDQQ